METDFDVVVMGGGFSGSSVALLIKRRHPMARVLIVERSGEFDRKVGESTAEVSACFLTRVLGETRHLGHHHLPKYGLRMWFGEGEEQAFEDCVELGARYNTRLPSYQIDRSTLDTHLLGVAASEGCEVLRPCRLKSVELNGAGRNRLTLEDADGVREVVAGWVVDASGKAAVLARKLGIFHKLEAHPTSALWARFRGVRDWDGHELRQSHPMYAKACRTARNWATNHLMSYGAWCWMIPLKGGDWSIGLVYDSRLYTPPEGADIPSRIKEHVVRHPVGRTMLSDIEAVGGDARAYSNMPYYSDKLLGDGWCLVGDAAGFMDPLYSPGLDFCSYTVSIASKLVGDALDGMDWRSETDRYNAEYRISFHTWFETIYKDKYHYMGDAQLMSAALLLDVATYFIGPLRYVYDDTEREFVKLPFQGVPGKVFGAFMRLYNRRLSRLAQCRRAKGIYGWKNHGWRELYDGFTPDLRVRKLLYKGVGKWLAAEIGTALARPQDDRRIPQPVPAAQGNP